MRKSCPELLQRGNPKIYDSNCLSNVSGSSFTNCLYREFKLHFSVVRYSVLGVRFHCTTVYLHDLFLHLIIGGVQILIACLVYVKNNLTHLNYIVGWRERDLENASKDQTCSIWITRSQMYFYSFVVHCRKSEEGPPPPDADTDKPGKHCLGSTHTHTHTHWPWSSCLFLKTICLLAAILQHLYLTVYCTQDLG